MPTKINWFEIPSTDFARAVKFYEAVFKTKLKMETLDTFQIGIFSDHDENHIGGVVYGEQFKPHAHGIVLYLDAGPSIDQTLARVEPAGGHIQMTKTALPKSLGFIAYFIDTEGNRIGLHSMT